MTNLELVSKEDLQVINSKIDRMLELLEKKQVADQGEWLRSGDVRRLLKCGASTLLTYREKGFIPTRKIGGTYYYRREDVLKLLENS
jgi:hypothetical protein